MLYLRRKIDKFLVEWGENPERKPLIVKGPRQVGKTESINKYANENYENVIYINFVEEPKYKVITTDGYKAGDIIKNISRIDPSKSFGWHGPGAYNQRFQPNSAAACERQ